MSVEQVINKHGPDTSARRSTAREVVGMSEKLKPCPFCGAHGDLAELPGGEVSFFYVRCESCAAVSEEYTSELPAIEQWNNRPGEDALRQQRDELARMVLAVAYLAGMSPNVCQLCLGVRGDHAEQCPAARATAYLHEGK